MTGRHEVPGEEAPTPAPDTSRTVEIKVVAAAVVTLLASVAYAVLDAVGHSPQVLDGLPPLVRFAVIAAIPAVLSFLAGWVVPSNRA